MRKTLVLVLLLILLIGCAAKVDKNSNETKETAEAPEKETVLVKEIAQEKREPAQEKTAVAVEEPEITETTAIIDVGETKTVTLNEREYRIKLLSVSNRAQFLVNGEVTKDLILNGVDVLKDQAEITLLELLYNAAEIKIKAPPKKEAIDTESLRGKGPQKLATGIFQTVEKTTAGHAEITRTAEGQIVLQLQGFMTEPGSGLYVYLIDQNIAEGYEVAKLTTISGGQTYNLHGDIDISKYKKIVIYSKSEEKVYGEAVLT